MGAAERPEPGKRAGTGITEVTSLHKTSLPRIWIFLVVFSIMAGAAWAQDVDKGEQPKPEASQTETEKFFDFTAPQGFEEEPSDESGIQKWKKGNGEILLVVGSQFSDSPQSLFESIVSALKENQGVEGVERLEMKGGLAVAFLDKKPEEPGRLRTWRVIVFAGKKIVNLDFAAPAGEFDNFRSDFETALKSFKLTLPGS